MIQSSKNQTHNLFLFFPIRYFESWREKENRFLSDELEVMRDESNDMLKHLSLLAHNLSLKEFCLTKKYNYEID